MLVIRSNKYWLKIRAPLVASKIAICRSLEGSTFVREARVWLAKATIPNLKKLFDNKFKLDDSAYEMLYPPVTSSDFKIIPNDEKRMVFPKLLKELRPFQKEAVRFFEYTGGRALLGDEMGLGKTISSLAWTAFHSDSIPTLVVCPASIKLNWSREITNTIPGATVYVLSGRTPSQLPRCHYYVVNYSIISAWATELLNVGIRTCVIDECHNIKNETTQQAKATIRIAQTCKHIIPMSGTPIVNRPIEFFSVLKLVRPDLFKSKFEYALRYCRAHKTRYGWDMTGHSNVQELHNILMTNRVMLRRLKKEVLKELPDLVRTVLPMEISNRKDYKEALTDVATWAITHMDATKKTQEQINKVKLEGLARMQALRKIAVLGKLDSVFAWLDDFIESGEKIIVFGWHIDVLTLVKKRYSKIAVHVDGSTPNELRQKYVDMFQNNKEIQMFIGNIKACKEGLTLTAASHECFIETTWSPGDQDQAEARAHRIGQKDAVNVWYFVAENTIEEDIISKLDSKRKVITNIIDGKEVEDDAILMDLFDKIKKQKGA